MVEFKLSSQAKVGPRLPAARLDLIDSWGPAGDRAASDAGVLSNDAIHLGNWLGSQVGS